MSIVSLGDFVFPKAAEFLRQVSEDGWEDEPRAPRVPRADGHKTARILPPGRERKDVENGKLTEIV